MGVLSFSVRPGWLLSHNSTGDALLVHVIEVRILFHLGIGIDLGLDHSGPLLLVVECLSQGLSIVTESQLIANSHQDDFSLAA